jgi:hypothetical protein
MFSGTKEITAVKSGTKNVVRVYSGTKIVWELLPIVE